MPLTDGLRELKLHTATTGDVWAVSWSESHPRCVAASVDDFVKTEMFRQADAVYVFPLPENIRLINELYLKKFDQDFSLWLASPLFAGMSSRRRDPVSVLNAMHLQETHVAASLGGWHKFDQDDYISYAMTEQLTGDPVVSDYVLHLLRAHPAWPSLSFVVGLDAAAVCRVLAELLDPRWYVDASQPSRTSRLESYMGMSLRTQRAVTDLMKQTATRGLDQEGMDKLLVKYSDYDRRMLNRCMSVIKCWIAPAEYIEAPFAASEHGVAPIQMPGAFLWRVWFSHGRSSKGMLRASQTFLRFLRDVWMDAIYVDTVGDGLFVPEYFFKHSFEAKSFVQHVATFKN